MLSGTMFWSCNQHKDGKGINEPSALEFADAKYIAIGMQSLTKLAEGDVDAFMNDYADDAVYMEQWR